MKYMMSVFHFAIMLFGVKAACFYQAHYNWPFLLIYMMRNQHHVVHAHERKSLQQFQLNAPLPHWGKKLSKVKSISSAIFKHQSRL